MLVGLLFAFLYLAVQELRDGDFFAQEGLHPQSEYVYFSFVALTTLGFGDLSPSVGLPQALTVLEALTARVFLVTLVARLVTLAGPAERDRGQGVILVPTLGIEATGLALVGREPDCARIDELPAGARFTAALVVRGEAGVGKTALLE